MFLLKDSLCRLGSVFHSSFAPGCWLTDMHLHPTYRGCVIAPEHNAHDITSVCSWQTTVFTAIKLHVTLHFPSKSLPPRALWFMAIKLPCVHPKGQFLTETSSVNVTWMQHEGSKKSRKINTEWTEVRYSYRTFWQSSRQRQILYLNSHLGTHSCLPCS